MCAKSVQEVNAVCVHVVESLESKWQEFQERPISQANVLPWDQEITVAPPGLVPSSRQFVIAPRVPWLREGWKPELQIKPLRSR